LRKVAYFSMEIALEPDLPTYSGGLDVGGVEMLRALGEGRSAPTT